MFSRSKSRRQQRSCQKVTYLAIHVAVGLATAAYPRAIHAQSMPDLSVSLLGRVRSTEAFGTEQTALVEVEFSPPAKSAAGIRGVAYTDVEPDLETAPNMDVPLDPLERDELGDANEMKSGKRRPPDGPTKQQAMLAGVPYVLSPTYVQKAIDAALAAQGIMAALGRLDSLSSRAKTSALLPDARFRAARDSGQTLRLTPTTDDPYRYSQSGGLSYVIEGAVTWRLGRLVFASEELGIERLRLAQARERRRVAATTASELMAWQTAWRRVAAAGDRSTVAADDLAEATLRLDVLTDGWFSAHQPAADPLDSTRSAPLPEPKPQPAPAAEQRRQPFGASAT